MSDVRVAVVDDEPRIRELLELSLVHHGFVVRTAPDGAAALTLVREWMPDLIVLDVMMPKIDGFTLLPMLRRLTEAPIVMLTARGELDDKVAGLTNGADDYVSKPFEIAELIARLHAALRRPRLEVREVLRCGELEIELATREVRREGRRIDLSPLEYDLLVTLARRPGRIYSREELLDLVWGVDADVGPNAVERYISYLRAKIDESFATKLVQTIRGVGYVLRAD